MTLKLLLDTNVWLDHFLDRSARHDLARNVVIEAARRNIILLCAVHSLKDCYFLVNAELRRMERAENGTVSASAAASISEVAWSCIRSMRKLSYIVPADDSDVVEAAIMRANHHDFEGNLIIAAADRAQADHVVTSDAALLAHHPNRCISLDDASKLIADQAQSSQRPISTHAPREGSDFPCGISSA